MHEAVQRGAALLVRLNPFSVVLSDAQGQPLSLVEALKRQKTETIRTLEVVIASADGEAQVRGWVHAYRLNPEQAGRARQKCRQRHKKGTPKADTLYLAGWVVVFTTLAPGALRPDHHGALSLSLASGNRDQTLEKCPRCRCPTGQGRESFGRGVAAWQITLRLDAGAAHAAPTRR